MVISASPIDPIKAADIEAALDAVLSTLLDQQADRQKRAVQIEPATFQCPPPTRVQSQIGNLATDPMGASLRAAVRWLGERADELGGLELMQQICGQVSALDPANESRRLSLLNSKWDGIGYWRS